MSTTTCPIAVAAARISDLFPYSVRTWPRLDPAGKTPRGHRVGQKKLWNIADLERWAGWGYVDRAEFDRRAAEEGKP